MSSKSSTAVRELAKRVREGDRAALARAITLVEFEEARAPRRGAGIAAHCSPSTGKGVRIGVTGVPGVGKSTTIDALGTYLTDKGHRVAVLAVDPSSVQKRRVDPRRQDANASIGRRRKRVYPPVAFRRHTGRRRKPDTRNDALVRSSGIRRRDRGDGRRRPVGDRRCTDDRHLSRSGCFRVRAMNCRGSRRACSNSPTWSPSTKRTATIFRVPRLPRRRSKRRCISSPGSAGIGEPPVLTYSALKGEGIDRLWQEVRLITVDRWKSPAGSLKSGAINRCAGCGLLIDERFRDRLRSDTTIKARLRSLEAAVPLASCRRRSPRTRSPICSKL